MPHIISKIAEAIENRRVISLRYDPGSRNVEPHAIGYSSDGNVLLRAYQTNGASKSGEHEHWKLLRLDRADAILVTESTFANPRPGYRRGDPAMKGGIVREL